MSAASKVVLATLTQIRGLLLTADEGIRPDTEYLRDELRRLLEQVDTLGMKVEKEVRLACDKEALQ